MDVTMPQLGETVTEGTITRWFKQVGDLISADEPLFEVSTDKVDSEVPAPSSGVLSEIRIAEGDTARVGTVLAVIADPSVRATEAPAAEPPTAPLVEALPSPPEPPPAAVVVMAPPVAPPIAAPAPSPEPATPVPAPESVAVPPVATPSGAVVATAALTTPVVRRLIAEHGLDPASITGTGEGGRITRKDVLDAAGSPGGATPPAVLFVPVAPAPTPPALDDTPTQAESVQDATRGDVVVPFTNMRRRTAEHMLRSKATSAHVYTSVEVDFERVQRVRAANAPEWKQREGFSLTYLPFIARAFCDTIDDDPNVTASVVDDTLVVHSDVHLAIAVDLDFGGLIAPVIRGADGMRLRAIAREMRDLATRARAKQLMPDEVLGGTFTITNPGPYGTFLTLPIINQPQVAILSTDGIAKQARVIEGVDGGDLIAVRHVGMLALAWDHRAFDGAYAAAFLNGLKEHLEGHDWTSELD